MHYIPEYILHVILPFYKYRLCRLSLIWSLIASMHTFSMFHLLFINTASADCPSCGHALHSCIHSPCINLGSTDRPPHCRLICDWHTTSTLIKKMLISNQQWYYCANYFASVAKKSVNSFKKIMFNNKKIFLRVRWFPEIVKHPSTISLTGPTINIHSYYTSHVIHAHVLMLKVTVSAL
jgi:hypothetical protein